MSSQWGEEGVKNCQFYLVKRRPRWGGGQKLTILRQHSFGRSLIIIKGQKPIKCDTFITGPLEVKRVPTALKVTVWVE